MVNVVEVKAGATLHGLAPAGIRILAACDDAAQVLKRDLLVTCGTDSHPPTDPHTLGNALDLRTKGLPEATVLTLVNTLRKRLGGAFTVLYEAPEKPLGVLASIAYVNPGASAPHIHIQLVKGFGPYPPSGEMNV